MKNKILDIFKENLTVKISIVLILLFPIALMAGSAIINLFIVLMNITFLIHIFKEKKFQVFNNDISYLLFILWAFLILNTLLNGDFKENYSRSFGFIRFLLLVFSLSYFLSYKQFKYKKVIFNIWSIIFLIVTFDLIFELYFGFNTFGFDNKYYGRLSSFMGEDLKIGHWYLCFSLIALSNNFNRNKTFFVLILLSIIISFFIGERANFIRLFIAIFFLALITRHLTFKNLGILTILIIFMTLMIGNSKSGSNMHVMKGKFMDQFISLIVKHDSIKELNNNNLYTPMYVNAYNLFKENKLLGIGVGTYLEKSHEIFRKHKQINGYKLLPNTHPHQYHFEILATIGLPGYIVIFLFLLYFFYKSFCFYMLNKEIVNLSSLILLLVMCLPLLPTGSFFTTFGASIFWLNFSLMNLGNFKNINY